MESSDWCVESWRQSSDELLNCQLWSGWGSRKLWRLAPLVWCSVQNSMIIVIIVIFEVKYEMVKRHNQCTFLFCNQFYPWKHWLNFKEVFENGSSVQCTTKSMKVWYIHGKIKQEVFEDAQLNCFSLKERCDFFIIVVLHDWIITFTKAAFIFPCPPIPFILIFCVG